MDPRARSSTSSDVGPDVVHTTDLRWPDSIHFASRAATAAAPAAPESLGARASEPPAPADRPPSPPPPASNSRKRAPRASAVSTGASDGHASDKSTTTGSNSSNMAEPSEYYGSMQQREPLPPPRASKPTPKALDPDADLEAAKLRRRAQPRSPLARWLMLGAAAAASLLLTAYYFSCSARSYGGGGEVAALADPPSPALARPRDAASDRRAALSALAHRLAAFAQPEERVSANGALHTTLHVRPAHFTDGPISFWTRAYEGRVPGPTLRVKPGDLLSIELVNELGPETPGQWTMNSLHSPNTTNLHVHGMHVDPTGIADNVSRVVGPGERALTQIRVPLDHPRGLFHYHPHFHGSVFAQMGGGMVGALFVDPDAAEERALPAAYRAMTQQLLVLQEFRFSGGLGSSAVAVAEASRSRLPLRLRYTNKVALDAAVQELYPRVHQSQPSIKIDMDDELRGAYPAGPPLTDYFTVNGQYLPRIALRPRENRLLRLVNAGGVCMLQLSVPGCSMTLASTDGIFLQQPRAVETLLLAAGSRADVVVNCAPNDASSSEREPLRPLQSVRDLALDGFVGSTSDVFAGVVAFFHVQGESLEMAPIAQLPAPTPLYGKDASLLQLSRADAAAMAPAPFAFEFTMGGTAQKDGFTYKNYYVNGKEFDGTSSREMPLGVVQEWVIVNKQLAGGDVAKANHPFHMHTNAFQVVAMSHGEGAEYRVGDWRDVISVPTPGNVTIRFRPVDFTGLIVAHCHTLGHSDGGMIAAVTIVP